MGLNKSRTPALGFSVSVRGTKCTAGAADGFSHVLLSMALSEPLRCLGTGLMLAEGNHHSYSKNPPCRRETMGFVPQLPVLIASSAVYCTGYKCSCWCMDRVLILQ